MTSDLLRISTTLVLAPTFLSAQPASNQPVHYQAVTRIYADDVEAHRDEHSPIRTFTAFSHLIVIASGANCRLFSRRRETACGAFGIHREGRSARQY
jgi:hypothetical protein